ncbi:MAG: hypothetical protein V4663_01420 [Bacteroidota bacterium]
MAKFFKITCLLAISLIFSSCEKISVNDVDVIGYGTSFGMCAGYCVNNLTINDENVVFSKIKRGTAPDTKTCTAKLSASEANEIKKLISQAKIDKLPKTIGCPDCADGGAEWVSVTSNSKEYKVVFEYGKAPSELAEVVVKLRALKETFINCN